MTGLRIASTCLIAAVVAGCAQVVPQGSGGCNGYASDEPVKISSGALEMPEMLMTLGACVGPNGEDLPVMAIENAFWTALNAGDRIGFRGDQLVISGTAGEIVFNPRPG